IDRRREAAQKADPLRKREEELRREQARVEKSSERLVTAYQEGLLTLAQLRQRMPALQKQTQAVETELQSLKMAAVDEAKYLQLAESLAGFRSKLRVRADALDIAVRQQILRLLVKEVLVGVNTITLRHSIPIPQSGPGSNGSPAPSSGVTGSRPNPGYLLRSGSLSSATCSRCPRGCGEGGNPGMVRGEHRKLEPAPRPAERPDQDRSALRTAMWTKPGEGYSYSSGSPHVASIVLRRLTGMEMQQYLDEKLAKPMGFGPWGYALHRNGTTLPHTPGGGSIAVRATDAVRFAYLLLHKGRWGSQQLVPAEYVALCGRPSPYNPHSPFSLMFEVNADGHVFGAPRDAFFKSGAGGSAIYVVPSLDLAIYKMAGSDAQFDPELTGLPVTYLDHSRDNWKPLQHDQFQDCPV